MVSTARPSLGRRLRLAVAGAAGTTPYDLNQAGTIVGVYTNPDATPSPQPAVTPMGRTA